MTTGSPRPRWLVVRQSPLAPEEQQVLAALRVLAAERGSQLVEVLLGNASYEVEDAHPEGGEFLLLEEDRKGRGLVIPSGVDARAVSEEELVRQLFTSPKVIQFP